MASVRQDDVAPGSLVQQLGIRHWAALIAIAMSLYHLSTPIFGEPIAEVYRPIHVAFVLAVLFCFLPERQRRFPLLARISDFSLVALTVAATGYLVLNVDYVTQRLAYVTPLTTLETVLASAMVLVILEAARRTVGWTLVVITAVFIVYAVFGNMLPDPLWHRGLAPTEVLERLYLTLDGIWGVPVGVTASYVFLFVLFGSLLLSTGGGAFFSDLARILTGRSPGGPAKSAVVASAFLGTLSGSTPANVVTSGSFTIPAMKSRGYPAHFAGGVEAAASTGGQLMPPIMGAAAFIMVEFTGISYVNIIVHALIPALLYFLAVFVMVTFEAHRLGLRSAGDEALPSLSSLLLRRGYLLAPLVVMIVYLALGYTPSRAAFAAVLALMALSFLFDPVNRANFVEVVKTALIHAPRVIGPVTVACACGGIIIGVVIMTGLGQKLSTAVIAFSGGMLLPTLVLTAMVSVVLGMGMPTSGAYIIMASLLAPAIVDYGVPMIAAHMFLLYCASMSAITPPVAIASYAAAGVAEANPWRTSLAALRLASSVFMIPFLFVYGPELLLVGQPLDIVVALATAVVGICTLSTAIIGWFASPMPMALRLGVAAGSLGLVAPGWISNLLGAGIVLALLGLHRARTRRMTRDALSQS